MKYPTLSELNTSREIIEVFKGYNHNLRIGEGEFYDMTNLTSADYPVLSPRPQRGVYAEPKKPQGMIAKDALCYVDGDTLYINEYPIEDSRMTLCTECDTCPKKLTCTKYEKGSTVCEKTMISMGAYIIIMPDKKYLNTSDYSDCGDIESDFTVTSGLVTFELCKLDGTEYSEETIPKGVTAPDSPSNMDLWIDTSSTPHVLKQYAETTAMWTSVATTYIKISFPNTTIDLTTLFSDNDGVTISGIEDPSLKEDLNNTMIAWKVGTNYIVVTGIIDEIASQEATTAVPVSIKRMMPNMDFIIESDNRLWGCRYGIALNDEVVNEIYASKLGDFKNWNCFAGISTDSYAATVGTDGQFTGAITHLGYPLFFKENFVHKVYGNYPANYQIQTTACRGVQNGCSKSLAIVNETLYYKSRSAVCSYDGSLPVEVSFALGDVRYEDAVSGVLGNKYYISMKDDNDEYSLFVYDTLRGMWHREDDTQVADFCNCRGNLYYIDYADKQIKTVIGIGDEKDTAPVKWKAITGTIGTDSPDKKYISRLVVRILLDMGTSVSFSAEYDSSGDWEHLFTMSGTTLRSFSVPIKPKRCDHLRLRIVGEGNAKIYSICKTIEQGSDV
jgi:hypothetical protein